MDYITISNSIPVAHSRIKDNILKTPVLTSHVLSEMIDGHVFLKLESEQYTGSFKARGSLNKILSLTAEERSRGLITASTGNHGLGFARAVEIVGAEGTVYLPKSASQAKIKRLGYFPVELVFHDGDSLSTELYAKQKAQESGAIWISPYNDYDVITGQGTIALELFEQIKQFDDVLITVGGGGLLTGIASYIKDNKKDINVVCCQPKHSMEMTLSLREGKIVSQPDAKTTLSDGSAGGIEKGSVTFEIAQQVIDHCITVSEEEIITALELMIREHGKIIEGSAAVAIAALLKEKNKFKGRSVVIIICGGNIEFRKLKNIICK